MFKNPKVIKIGENNITFVRNKPISVKDDSIFSFPNPKNSFLFKSFEDNTDGNYNLTVTPIKSNEAHGTQINYLGQNLVSVNNFKNNKENGFSYEFDPKDGFMTQTSYWNDGKKQSSRSFSRDGSFEDTQFVYDKNYPDKKLKEITKYFDEKNHLSRIHERTEHTNKLLKGSVYGGYIVNRKEFSGNGKLEKEFTYDTANAEGLGYYIGFQFELNPDGFLTKVDFYPKNVIFNERGKRANTEFRSFKFSVQDKVTMNNYEEKLKQIVEQEKQKGNKDKFKTAQESLKRANAKISKLFEEIEK